jgi:hypothetical protein
VVNENDPFAFVVATTVAAAPWVYGAIATGTPASPAFDAKSTTVPDAVAFVGVGDGVGVAVAVAFGVGLALGALPVGVGVAV